MPHPGKHVANNNSKTNLGGESGKQGKGIF